MWSSDTWCSIWISSLPFLKLLLNRMRQFWFDILFSKICYLTVDPLCSKFGIRLQSNWKHWLGAGIAQWLEHRTHDWKVAGSNPCWNGGRIFFSRVDFLCWLLFRYPFHPRVTTVARKKSRSFCQKCRWQVTAKHAYTLRMWILLNRASALVTTCP